MPSIYLSDTEADAVAAILADAAREDGAAVALAESFAAGLADAKAAKRERLETWLNTKGSHAASVDRVTEPDGEDVLRTLIVTLEPDIPRSAINEVLRGVRGHLYDFLGVQR